MNINDIVQLTGAEIPWQFWSNDLIEKVFKSMFAKSFEPTYTAILKPFVDFLLVNN